MTDAFESENPQGGQLEDNVGQDVGNEHSESSEQDWEATSKYHQSEKDKLSVENDKLRKYEKIGKLLESRPDVVQNIVQQVKGGGQPQAERIDISQDEFDPWEAYNDPKSKSYQYREQLENERVGKMVDQRMSGVQRAVGFNNLQNNIVNSGLVDTNEVGEFMDFINKNPSDYGLENVVKMWRATRGNETSTQENPLDQVRENQQNPTPGGILQGQQPQRKSEADEVWESVMKAGSRKNVL